MNNRESRRNSEGNAERSRNLEVVSAPDDPVTVEVYHLTEAEEAAFNVGNALDNYVSKWRRSS